MITDSLKEHKFALQMLNLLNNITFIYLITNMVSMNRPGMKGIFTALSSSYKSFFNF